MILVVGSTGLVGSEVCQRLLARGESVRALVRHSSNPERVAALRQAGAELAFGDLKDPGSLVVACQGVQAIISTASSTFSRQEGDSIRTVDAQGQLHLVEAAKHAGVHRFLFVSFRVPEGISSPLADAKLHVEHAIADLNHTVLRASFFMETWLNPMLGFDYANAAARIYGAGTNPVSWVSYHDVAEMCVRALHHPAADRAALDFGGPESISPLDVVRTFEKISGTRYAVEHVPEAALRAQWETAQDPLQKSLASIMLGYALGDAMDMTETQQAFDLKLTSVEEYARRVLSR